MPDFREIRKITDLYEWNKNPRSIKERDFERLKTQITKLGQYKPVIITPDGEVIGGNMRLKAYRDLGITDVWVSVVKPKDENEKLEYALSDNDRAGFYDGDLLGNLSADYPDFNWNDYAVDLNKPQTLNEILDKLRPSEEDEVPEVEDKSISKPGEIYHLGDHVLMCGDSTKESDIERLMGSVRADMVFTDPPYQLKNENFGTKNNRKYGNLDSSKVFDYEDWLMFADKYTKENARILVFEQWSNTYKLWTAMDKFFPVKGLIIWYTKNRHNTFLNPATSLFNKYDICLQAMKGKKKTNPSTSAPVDLIDDNVASLNETGQEKVFGTKTMAVLMPYIEIYSNPGEVVLDLFGGAGSTLIACERTKRVNYSMEIYPAYCDVIRKRYAKFIGKEDQWQQIK